MPLSTPTVARSPRHIRHVHYASFEREDGLWDLEGELIDTKAMDTPRAMGNEIRKAGDPVHHMRIRVTIDTRLVVHAIEAAMPAHPVQGCPGALAAMQRMVGCSMAKGWRKAVQTNLEGVTGCTHMRELLTNMATAAFQSIVSAFEVAPDQPPAYLGQCTGWDFQGAGVATYYPQFVGRANPSSAIPAAPVASSTPLAPTPAAIAKP